MAAEGLQDNTIQKQAAQRAAQTRARSGRQGSVPSGTSGRWGRCFTRVPQPWECGGRRRDTLPHPCAPSPRLPAKGFVSGTGAPLGKESEASPAGWSKAWREGDTSLSPADQLSFNARRGSRSSSPTGERRETLRRCTAGLQRETRIHAEIVLSGRFVGSNFSVQTGIYKLLCIDYIYPTPLSSPRPAARVPPAATAPPRPGLGVASGSSFNSRGKCQ